MHGEKRFTTLETTRKVGAALSTYGLFIMTIIHFLIIAFVVFMSVWYVDRVKEVSAKAALAVANQGDLLAHINDALNK